MAKDIHDLTIKSLMAHKSFFIGFCDAYLPPEILQQIDWHTAELFHANGEIIREKHHEKPGLGKEIADIAYCVRMGDDKGLIYVHAEHFSHPKKRLPLTMAHYGLGLLLDYAKANKQSDLPTLIPLVYYHGKQTPYPYTLELKELFASPDVAAKYLFNPGLIDLGQMSDEELKGHKPICGAELAFKHIFDPNFGHYRADIIWGLQQMDENSRRDVLRYSLIKGSDDPEQFLKEYIEQLPEEKEAMMTMAEQLEQKGMQQGMERGMEQERENIARNLIENGIDDQIVAKSTGLPAQEVADLKAKIT